MDIPSPHARVEARAIFAALGVGLALRVAAALVVDGYVGRRGMLCLFDDARIYWHLAGELLGGRPYVVWQYDQPHYALRTPGYPLFLAACRAAFGPSTLAVRLAQAALGASTVWILARLVGRLAPGLKSGRGWRSAPVLAAWIAAIEPYHVASAALLLSEAVFVPLMLAMLLGLAGLWGGSSERRGRLVALLTGLAAGSAVLVRPSWALFVPLGLFSLIVSGQGWRMAAVRRVAVVVLGLILVMGPWWIRNALVFGRFVPTALWAGASLYDGLRPDADGSSDMRFLERIEIRTLDETTQDRTLRAMAIEFARSNPLRTLKLAAIKAGRYWSPWPNADQFSSPAANLASASVVLPLYLLMIVGLWMRRADPRAWLLLAGPLLYFAALHLLFVSSIRYRISASVPAFGLAAFGLVKLMDGWAGQGTQDRKTG